MPGRSLRPNAPAPDNLTATVFRALYPGYDLLIIGTAYVVYAPYVPGRALIYIAQSLGRIAQQISEHENSDAEVADIVADETDPLPSATRS